MPPDSPDADPTELPRAFRGYHRAATEELFRRVAWDYGVLAGEHRKLKKELEEREATPPAPAAAPRPEPDETARWLFAAALRAVRDLRDAARAECEAALRKARRRAAEIEARADHDATASLAVIAAAAELRAKLRSTLTTLERAEPRSVTHRPGSKTEPG